MANHQIKILEKFAEVQRLGLKPWEVRVKDRDYKVGDKITFHIIDDVMREPTGRFYQKKITYILDGGQVGVNQGYCIMTIGEV